MKNLIEFVSIVCCLQRLCGGTTVCATMLAAQMAGIEVFVTGGIGGVHRNVHTSTIKLV